MESASPRSICHLRTEPVWPRGSLEEAELDQWPDRADDRDKPKAAARTERPVMGTRGTKPTRPWLVPLSFPPLGTFGQVRESKRHAFNKV